MVYTHMLDETAGAEPDARAKHRDALLHELEAPLDPREREEYENAHWGLSPEAIAEQETIDALFPETEE